MFAKLGNDIGYLPEVYLASLDRETKRSKKK